MLIFKTAYLALAERIRTNCPTIAHIDLWNDQPSHWDEQPVPLPAVLFNLLVDEWQDVSSTGAQTGRGSLEVHVLQERYSDLHDGAETQADALQRFDVLQAVHNALQNYAEPCFQSLGRSSQAFDPNHDALVDDMITYATVWIDAESTPISRQRYTTDSNIDKVTVSPNTVPEPIPPESPFIIPAP